MKLGKITSRHSRGVSLIDSLIVISTLSIIAAIGYLAFTNIDTLSKQTRFERDVITLNAAVRTYIATGGSFSSATTDSEVIAKLKQSLSKQDRETQVGSGGSLIDPRLSPILVSAGEATGKPRATWNADLNRFEIRNDATAGFSGFKFTNDTEKPPVVEKDRHTRLAFDKPGAWIWPVAPEKQPERIELTQLTAGLNYGGPGSAPPNPTRSKLNPPTFSHPATLAPLTTFPLNVTITDTNPAGTSKPLTAVNNDPLEQNHSKQVKLNPGDSLHGIAVSLDPDNWDDSDYVSKTYDTTPYALSLSIESPHTEVTYLQVGGAMIGGSPQVTSEISPSLVLDNVNGFISYRYINSKSLQIHWVIGDSDPINDPKAFKLPNFKSKTPTPVVDISLPAWENTASLRVRAAGVAIKPNLFAHSPIVETTITASPTQLPAPVITRTGDGLVSIALDTSTGEIPVDYRIFYTTDGTIPADEPLAANIYTGEIELPHDLCSTSSISARAYGPERYQSWFIPSTGTQLEESALANTNATAAFICRYNNSELCNYTWLVLGDKSRIKGQDAVIHGAIGVGPEALLDVDLAKDKSKDKLVLGDGVLTAEFEDIHVDPSGTLLNATATAVVDLEELRQEALTLTAEATALTPTQSFGKLKESTTIRGTHPDGMNVIQIDRVQMMENDTLEFTGHVDDYFVVLVSDKFDVGRRGKVIVTGGVDASHVLIVSTNGKSVTLKAQNDTINASFLAPQSKVKLSDSGVYTGHFVTGEKSRLENEVILTGTTKFGDCTPAAPNNPSVTPPPVPESPDDRLIVILADEELIDNGTSTVEIYADNVGATSAYVTNDDITTETGNPWLRLSSEYAGREILLPTGQAGDEGIFSTDNKFPFTLEQLTAGSIIQSRLDKVKGVEPINPNNYNCLVGRQVVAVIHKSDVSVDSDSGKANLQGERRGLLAFTVLGIEPAGSIAESGSSDSFPVLRVRIDPPVGISNLEAFECDSNPTSPGPGRGPGLASGHFDLDTSSFISPVNSGSTGKHVHQYDDKFDVPGADFFNLLQDGLSNINDEISPGTKFKVIIANADLSTGGRLVINNTYDPDRPDSWVSVQEYANIPLADLPVFTHKAASAKTTLLTQLGIYFDVNAGVDATLIPTNTGDVRKNVLGKYGEWRNGALTIQAVQVNGSGKDAFTTSTAMSSGGVQGVATSGLLWEATLFWHWKGDSYHESGNPHQPRPYSP